eukprot:TRINITY_DN16653_c0_g1_i1.p1 TRINITY_DN16653_c0_g1~~TRINITY_DN16653_c0_g1_i1.p1  ORF type:complete len:452 (-),score=58.05 TRINITY_DN16653_c0_g1_i1:178-1497(-)
MELRRRRELKLPALEVSAAAAVLNAHEEELPYDLGKILGKGSFSVVRLATRKTDAKRFAIKCIAAVDEERQDAVRDEYEIMRMFRNPAILTSHTLHIVGQMMYICMEFCEGGDVFDLVKGNGPLEEAKAQHLFMQLIRGVDSIHHKRIVHRDLKPTNLLLRENLHVLKIADFGSATQIGVRTGCVSVCMLTAKAGTSQYYAPEILFEYVWNERVDIWACGLCFYFMLQGTLPFDIALRKIRDCLRSGSLPDIEWGGLSILSQIMVRQCLCIDFRDRPPAMEVRQHPMLNAAHGFHRDYTPADEVNLVKSGNLSDLAKQITVTDRPRGCNFMLVHSCGLLCVHAMQNWPSIAPGGSRERPKTKGRLGSKDSHARHLQQLAERKCALSADGRPKAVSDQRYKRGNTSKCTDARSSCSETLRFSYSKVFPSADGADDEPWSA